MAIKNNTKLVKNSDEQSKKRKLSYSSSSSGSTEGSTEPSTEGSMEEKEVTPRVHQQEKQKHVLPAPGAAEEGSDESDESEREEGEKREDVRLTRSRQQNQSGKKSPRLDRAASKANQKPEPVVWKKEDEEAMLRAMEKYHKAHGKLPMKSGYGALLPDLQGRLSFTATATQLYNKSRAFRKAYWKLLETPSASAPTSKDGKEMKRRFEMWDKWFGKVPEKQAASKVPEKQVADGGSGPVDYTCLCRVAEEAAKKSPELSRLASCSSAKLEELLGHARARDLEKKLKKCEVDQMRAKAEELKLAAGVILILVKKWFT